MGADAVDGIDAPTAEEPMAAANSAHHDLQHTEGRTGGVPPDAAHTGQTMGGGGGGGGETWALVMPMLSSSKIQQRGAF